MKQIKKTLSIVMVVLFVMAGILGHVTSKAAVVTTTPTISRVGLGHPLIAGDTRTFTVTSATYVGKVQYRAFVVYGNNTNWTEITTGYTTAVDGKAVVVLPATKAFIAGNYRLSVWVKKAGTVGIKKDGSGLGSYDSYKVSNLTCAAKISPVVSRVGLGHSPLFVGDTRTFTVTSPTTVGKVQYVGNVQYRAFLNDGKSAVWTEVTSGYTAAVDSKSVFVLPATAAFKAGTYRLSVWVKAAGTVGNITTPLGSYDNYKVSNLTCVVNPNASKDVKVFETTVKPSTTGFGSIGNVTLTADGVKNFATATQYQIFDGANAITALSNLGTATTVFPAKVLGNLVSVKLFDASAVLVKSIDVKLGEAGTIPVVVVVPPVEAVVNATVKPSTTGFGSIGNVTSTQAGAVSYQLFDGTNAISAISALGTATTVFPGKVVGQKVTVELFNAAGTVIATKTLVTLVAAQ